MYKLGKSVKLSVMVTVFVMSALIAKSQNQQIFTGPIQPVYSPRDILENVAGPLARSQLDLQPVLDYNGYWTDNGAVITSGRTGGSVAWNVTVGSGVSSTRAHELSYHLDLINLNSDEAILVMKYTETNSSGGASTGMIELHRIKRSHPNQSFPVDQGSGGATGVNISPSTTNSSGGQGYWMQISVPFAFVYINDGTLYIVEGHLTGNIWVPGGTVGGGRDKNHL